jgi:hypothetical protein
MACLVHGYFRFFIDNGNSRAREQLEQPPCHRQTNNARANYHGVLGAHSAW